MGTETHEDLRTILIKPDTNPTLIGLHKEAVAKLFRQEADYRDDTEWVYTIRSFCFGLIKKRLHIFFAGGIAYEYYCGI